MQQRGVVEDAAVEGAEWLRKILEAENHSAHELAASLTDSPLKVSRHFGARTLHLDIAAKNPVGFLVSRPCGSLGTISAWLLTGGHPTPTAAVRAANHVWSVGPSTPLQPFWVSQAQAILFYTFSKSAALAGRAKGHGFLVTR